MGRPSASPGRQAVAVLAAALLAAVGAVILGEYALTGAVAVVAALLYGLAVAEVGLVVAKRLHRATVVALVLVAAGGDLWALWISSAHFLAPLPTTSLLGVPLAGVAAAAWLLSGGHSGGAPAGAAPDGDGGPAGVECAAPGDG